MKNSQKKNGNKLFSLRFSLSSAFIFIVIATVVSIGVPVFMNISSTLRNEIREKLKTSAAVSVLSLNGDLHQRVQTAEDESTDAYLELKKQLQQIRDTIGNVKYVYTYRINPEGQVYFVVDAEENPDDMSHIGDVYDEATTLMFEAIQKPGEVFVEKDFDTDEWGTWLTSYATVYRSDGTVECALGIDMSAQMVKEYERKYMINIFLTGIIISLIVMILGILFARRLSQPLLVLADDLKRIQKFDLEGSVKTRSVIREIELMIGALDNMKKGLRSFKRYVPSDLVSELIQLQKEADLNVEKKEVSVFFSDIEGFTTLCEKISNEELPKRLSVYFEGMTRTILENKGTVDKFIGDAIMSFWGAPLPMDNHAVMACRTALQCQTTLDTIFREWELEGIPLMHTRIGINTGDALIGNIGYVDRLSYTALGDSVNLASRLEGLNKYYGTKIIISHFTHQLIKNNFETRLLDRVVVKGKSEGINIFELIAEKGKLNQGDADRIGLFTQGMQYYLNRQWDKAVTVMYQVLKIAPDDLPSKIIIKRCENFMVNPPDENWNGLIVLREK